MNANGRLLIPIVPLFVLAAWIWIETHRVHRQLKNFGGFEALHLDL